MKLSSLLFFGLCLLLIGCNTEKTHPENKLDSHKVISPLIKNASYNDEYVAEIHSVHYVEVRSKVKGYLEQRYVDEGQAVKQGQLLFALNPAEFEKELQKANAAYKSALADVKASEVDLSNVKRLVEKNIVAKTELEVAQAKLAALKADVEQAQADKEQAALQLEFTKIKAPYNGVINRIPNKVGSLIAEGDILTSISDNNEVFAYFNVSESDYLNTILNDEHHHKPVQLKLANNELYPHQGKIEMIESEFDKVTGNIAIRARFTNPDDILKHGAHGKIVINRQLNNVMQIPQKSTFEIQDKLFVFVVKPDDTVEQRNVIAKMHLTDFYVLESGLKPEEKIVFEGVESMKNGTKIQPIVTDLTEEMLASKE